MLTCRIEENHNERWRAAQPEPSDPDAQPHADARAEAAAARLELSVEPGEVYFAGIIATTLLVAPFNALARVIVLTWFAGHLAYQAGVDELSINVTAHLAGLMIGARYLRSEACVTAFALYLPLLAIDLLRCVTTGHAETLWWAVLTTAFGQLIILPLGIEWAQVAALRKRGLSGWWAAMPRDFLRGMA